MHSVARLLLRAPPMRSTAAWRRGSTRPRGMPARRAWRDPPRSAPAPPAGIAFLPHGIRCSTLQYTLRVALSARPREARSRGAARAPRQRSTARVRAAGRRRPSRLPGLRARRLPHSVRPPPRAAASPHNRRSHAPAARRAERPAAAPRTPSARAVLRPRADANALLPAQASPPWSGDNFEVSG
eukprot:3422824-Prymnesium_polylepis.1